MAGKNDKASHSANASGGVADKYHLPSGVSRKNNKECVAKSCITFQLTCACALRLRLLLLFFFCVTKLFSKVSNASSVIPKLLPQSSCSSMFVVAVSRTGPSRYRLHARDSAGARRVVEIDLPLRFQTTERPTRYVLSFSAVDLKTQRVIVLYETSKRPALGAPLYN